MGNRHNMPRKHKRTSRLLFLSVLILQILFAVFWSSQKAGFWVDELWSYGLANSYYHPYVYIEGPVEEGWVPGEYFGDYVTADTEHRFDYGSVFYNQDNGISGFSLILLGNFPKSNPPGIFFFLPTNFYLYHFIFHKQPPIMD